ncbi:hypothetical protein BSKO_02140 [Bryopsis sp. KO-2023]|nr:hypothetical protein BSKO_02140 [Bryopsis sp. KO-2023]
MGLVFKHRLPLLLSISRAFQPTRPAFVGGPSELLSLASLQGFRGCSTETSPQETLNIDRSAVERLKEVKGDAAEDKDAVLRIGIEGGGCSGFQYTFALGKEAEGDRVFERDGVKVVCDGISFDFLKGATVEYAEDLIKSAFQITKNPNSESSCGCGSSFVAKME